MDLFGIVFTFGLEYESCEKASDDEIHERSCMVDRYTDLICHLTISTLNNTFIKIILCNIIIFLSSDSLENEKFIENRHDNCLLALSKQPAFSRLDVVD